MYLDASYPEILTLLQAAAKQRNLPGPLAVDAVPVPVPAYEEAQLAAKYAAAKKDAAVGRTKLESSSKRRSVLDRLRKPSGK